MEFTRRHMLAAAMGVPPLLGQAPPDSFVVSSASGLRMERHGNPQRPAVALFLPETKFPSAIIEMPEHAWRKETADSEQAWFYRMYTSDRSMHGEVDWLKDGNALSFQ